MNDTINGLILKSMDYREHDALLTVLTKPYGKLTFRGAGLRRMNSRNAGSLFPYTEAEIQFDYRGDKTIFQLKTAHTLHLYRFIHEDLTAGSAAAAVGEIADAFSYSGDNENSRDLYELVQLAFQLLNDHQNPDLILALYISDVMRLSGIAPNVDACVRDGKTVVSAISAEEGGFLCDKCAKETGTKIRSASELHLFRLIVKAGLKHAAALEGQTDIRWCLKLLEDMLNRQGNARIRSFSLYNRIAEID